MAFILQGGETMDKLQKRAVTFRKLMKFQYIIKLGRNMTDYPINNLIAAKSPE